MKILFIAILITLSYSGIAQSLKDSLFSGKLKNDTGRTFTKFEREPTASIKVLFPDSLNKEYRSKQQLWKKFVEEYGAFISVEAQSSKKVKRGSYSIIIEYEIGLDGVVKTKGISCEPYNDYLILLANEMMSNAPLLAPPIHADRTPRKAKMKQPITINKID